jgi:hypothetical protein
MKTPSTPLIVLRSSKMLTGNDATQKAKQLATLQEEVYRLTLPFSGKFDIYDVFGKRDEQGTSIFLEMPPLYEKQDALIYLSESHNQIRQKLLGVQTSYVLTMHLFSDLYALTAFEAQWEKDPTIAYSIDTSYYFDTEGNYGKIVELPKNLVKGRRPLFADERSEEYISKMTAEDFLYAERAVTLMKRRLEDYNTVQKQKAACI